MQTINGWNFPYRILFASIMAVASSTAYCILIPSNNTKLALPIFSKELIHFYFHASINIREKRDYTISERKENQQNKNYIKTSSNTDITPKQCRLFSIEKASSRWSFSLLLYFDIFRVSHALTWLWFNLLWFGRQTAYCVQIKPYKLHNNSKKMRCMRYVLFICPIRSLRNCFPAIMKRKMENSMFSVFDNIRTQLYYWQHGLASK